MPDKNSSKAPPSDTLLVELLTEELPPKSLQLLAQTFASALGAELNKSGFVEEVRNIRVFATPRRLALLVPAVRDRSLKQTKNVPGPSVSAPQQQIDGFARKFGLTLGALVRQQTPKGEIYVAPITTGGQALEEVLAGKVQAALKSLPLPKQMRWGNGEEQFARPVHGLVMMHGTRTVPGKVLGLMSSNKTVGHRFLSKGAITIRDADNYEWTLENKGNVIASFVERRNRIETELVKAAGTRNAVVFPTSNWPTQDSIDVDQQLRKMQIAQVIRQNNKDLLDEVTAIVEWPAVYVGQFESEFLQVPPECISLTMQKNQRYFALTTLEGELSESYLLVSNTEVKNPTSIVEGNSRVLRARLSDARFFFEQDKKIPLADRVPRLRQVIFHSKLGTQLERVERIRNTSVSIVAQVKLNADTATTERRGFLGSLWTSDKLSEHVQRSAYLCKADLLTEMVGEFPELQGFIGAHYAAHDNEHSEVVAAIEGHYRPRFSGDNVFLTPVGISVALADKLDTLAGLFGIGQQPTGDKDPYGLRRAAIGVIRILIEHKLPISLGKLVDLAFKQFGGKIGDAHTDLTIFLLDRLRVWLREQGNSTNHIEAVLALNPDRIDLVPRQIEAVHAFNKLPEAESLAAANKRVVNILKQAETRGESFVNADLDQLKEPAERALFDALKTASQRATPLFKQGDFTGYLKTFAVLKKPVDAFFDSVMVMVDDRALRQNRLALLADLREQMNRVADISKLAA